MAQRVRHSSLRCSSIGCGVAQLVVRRLAVRQARNQFSARPPREVLPTELTSDEEMETGEEPRQTATDECTV